MPLPVTCAALIAGGASRRMGFNKALALFEGEPLIARVAAVLNPLFPNIVVVTADSAVEAACGLPAIRDIYPDKGPLGGVHTALTHFNQPVFCVACDLPFLRADVIQWLCESVPPACDVYAPRVDGRMEPLHAVYAPACLEVLNRELQKPRVGNVESVLASLRICDAGETDLCRLDPELKFLTNLNTAQEWDRALE